MIYYKIHKIITIIITCLAMWSCSSSQEEPVTPEKPLVPIDRKAVFRNDVSYKYAVSSRAGAIETNYLPKDHVVGIYGLNTTWGTNTDGNYVNLVTWATENINENLKNEPYVSAGSSTVLNSQKTFTFPNGEEAAMLFYGYSPYDENIIYTDNLSTPKAPRLKIDINQSMEMTEDYLYTGTVKVIPEGETTPVHLPFKHALARLNFRVYTNDVNFTDAYCPKLKKIQIITNNHQGGYMNIHDGTIEPGNGENITFNYELSSPYKITQSKKGEATETGAKFLFLPNDNAINSIILFVEDENGENKEYIAYAYYPAKNDPKKLMAGYVYTINIEYNVRSSFVCSITSWETNEDKNLNISDATVTQPSN